jgi:hypothetical protein
MFAAYSVLPYKTRRRLANMATAFKEQMDLLNPRTYPKALEPQESECE